MNGTRLYSWHQFTICILWITASQRSTFTLRFPKPRRSLKSTYYWHLKCSKDTRVDHDVNHVSKGLYAMSDLSYKSTENFATSKMPQCGPTASVTSTFKASGCEDGEQLKPWTEAFSIISELHSGAKGPEFSDCISRWLKTSFMVYSYKTHLAYVTVAALSFAAVQYVKRTRLNHQIWAAVSVPSRPDTACCLDLPSHCAYGNISNPNLLVPSGTTSLRKKKKRVVIWISSVSQQIRGQIIEYVSGYWGTAKSPRLQSTHILRLLSRLSEGAGKPLSYLIHHSKKNKLQLRWSYKLFFS